MGRALLGRVPASLVSMSGELSDATCPDSQDNPQLKDKGQSEPEMLRPVLDVTL